MGHRPNISARITYSALLYMYRRICGTRFGALAWGVTSIPWSLTVGDR